MSAMNKSQWLDCVMDILTPPSNRQHPDLELVRDALHDLTGNDLAALERVLEQRISDAKSSLWGDE